MGVDPAKVPQIKGAYTLPYEQVRNLCGTTCKTATGVYIEEEQKVYIGVKPYYKDRFIFSQLLHETVHHFQEHAGVKRVCDDKEEQHALSLQGVYLKSKGAGWFDGYIKGAGKTFNNGKCN